MAITTGRYRGVEYEITRGRANRWHRNGWYRAHVNWNQFADCPGEEPVYSPAFEKEVDADDFIRALIDMILDKLCHASESMLIMSGIGKHLISPLTWVRRWQTKS